MSIALQLAIIGVLVFPIFIILRISVDEGASPPPPQKKKKKKRLQVFKKAVVWLVKPVKPVKPCLAKERGTLDFDSLAGINCGVAKTDIVSVEGVRFAGGADLTAGREMTC